MDKEKLLIFANRSGEYFAKKIIKELNNISKSKIELGKLNTIDFADSEVKVIIKENVINSDVYLVQSCFDPISKRSVHDNFFEMCITVDALVQAGVKHINLIMPYHPFLRQDKQKIGESITSKLIANFIIISGAETIITTEIHNENVKEFYKKIKVNNLKTTNILANYIKEKYDLKDFVALAPDAGAIDETQKYADILNIDLIKSDKKRSSSKANYIEDVMIVGNVKDKNILIVDDMIDTGGTIKAVYDKLINLGAKKILICCTHALLNPPALDIIEKTKAELITTDTIYHGEDFTKNNKQIKVISLAKEFAKFIYNQKK